MLEKNGGAQLEKSLSLLGDLLFLTTSQTTTLFQGKILRKGAMFPSNHFGVVVPAPGDTHSP